MSRIVSMEDAYPFSVSGKRGQTLSAPGAGDEHDAERAAENNARRISSECSERRRLG